MSKPPRQERIASAISSRISSTFCDVQHRIEIGLIEYGAQKYRIVAKSSNGLVRPHNQGCNRDWQTACPKISAWWTRSDGAQPTSLTFLVLHSTVEHLLSLQSAKCHSLPEDRENMRSCSGPAQWQTLVRQAPRN